MRKNQGAKLPEREKSDTAGETADADYDISLEDLKVPKDAGFAVDAEIPNLTEEETPKRAKLTPITGGGAKGTPPKIDEWQDWFSRVVLRLGTDWYISQAFHGVDEELLSDRDLETIKMRKEERDEIAKPFAELANKLKWTRKHGRAIIASTASIESLISLGQWVARVNRVSRKAKRAMAARYAQPEPQQPPFRIHPETPHAESAEYDSPGQTPPPATAPGNNGNGGPITIVNPYAG